MPERKMKKKEFIIAGTKVEKGEDAHINLSIARLPSRTPIDIPVFVSRSSEEGPVLLLLAGLHGDEINGIEIIRRILTKGYNKPLKGSVICVPIMNIYGFLNFSRDLPDGKDVNRSFPGSKNGSLASRVAHSLMTEIIPLVDYGIDFHTGGASRANFPQIRCVLDDTINKDLAFAFAPPFILNSIFRPNSLRRESALLGKRIIVYEAGESMRFDKDAIQIGVKGIRRVMKYLGMSNNNSNPEYKTEILTKATWVRARYSGLFHYFTQNGKWVEKNKVIGAITDPFGDFYSQIKSPVDGYIISVNNNPVVNQGDALMHIGMLQEEQNYSSE